MVKTEATSGSTQLGDYTYKDAYASVAANLQAVRSAEAAVLLQIQKNNTLRQEVDILWRQVVELKKEIDELVDEIIKELKVIDERTDELNRIALQRMGGGYPLDTVINKYFDKKTELIEARKKLEAMHNQEITEEKSVFSIILWLQQYERTMKTILDLQDQHLENLKTIVDQMDKN